MKTIFKISGTLAATVLYCTVIYFIFGFLNHEITYFPNPKNINTETSYYETPINQKSFALPVKVSLTTPATWLELNSSFSKKISASIFKCAKLSFFTTIKTYILQSLDFPIQLRKKDIIFPFHYFW